MYKMFITFLVTLLFMFAATYFLLFTQSGNDAIKPYLQKLISRKAQMDIKLLKFTLKTDHIDIECLVGKDSKLQASGGINLFLKSFDIDYNIDAKDLKTKWAVIEGKLKIDGVAKGDLKKFFLNGAGEAMDTDIRFAALIEDKKPKNLIFESKQAKIDKILALLNIPSYSSGLAKINADLKNLDSQNPKGDINITVNQAHIDTALIKRDFDIDLGKSFSFNGDIKTKIENGVANSKINLTSTLANLNTKKTVYDINKAAFKSDYLVVIPKLSKLYPLTKRRLKGYIKAWGNVSYKDDKLIVDGSSKTLGGKVDFKAQNLQIFVKAKDISVKKLSSMLMYPAVFDAKADIKASFHTKTKRGDLNVTMQNGKLLQNSLTDLVYAFGSFDLTKERYNKSTLKADIDKNLATFDLDMKSKKSHIRFSEGKIDLGSNQIDTKFDISINDKDLSGSIKGNVNSVKVKIDSSKYIRKKIKKEIEKKLPKELQEPLKQILDLFKR